VKGVLALLAGALVGAASWWFGAQVGLPVVAVILTAGGLFGYDRIRAAARAQQAATAKLQAAVGELTKQTARRTDVWNSETRLREGAERTFHQVEAMINLHSLVRVSNGMPATRGWAASPDFLLTLVSLVEQHRPTTVLDLGSGSTTLWMASAMRTFGIEGRIVAVDHDEKYAAHTRQALVAHGLEKFAEVRHASLTDLELAGETWPWYDLSVFADVRDADLLVVDGPPGVLRSQARYPALPVLADRLTARARVVVDDYRRDDETAMVARWREELPGWALRELPHEKGCAVLSRD
jgi:predicted RNA methylase